MATNSLKEFQVFWRFGKESGSIKVRAPSASGARGIAMLRGCRGVYSAVPVIEEKERPKEE